MNKTSFWNSFCYIRDGPNFNSSSDFYKILDYDIRKIINMIRKGLRFPNKFYYSIDEDYFCDQEMTKPKSGLLFYNYIYPYFKILVNNAGFECHENCLDNRFEFVIYKIGTV